MTLVVLATVACGGGKRSPTAATTVTATTSVATAESITVPPGTSPGTTIETPTAPPTPAPTPVSPTVYLAGAGDIADADFPGNMDNAAKTAQLIAALPGFTTIFTAGDNEQSTGTYDKFMRGFDRTWGRLTNRRLPTPGNHDFTPGYFDYFGAQADPDGQGRGGFYRVKLSGAWQYISLNSAGSAASSSAQYAWLSQALADDVPCTIVVYHHPLQTNSENASATWMRDVWNLLYRRGVEIVVNGHNHVYERFGRKNDSLRSDPIYGVRQFTVGTGGYKSYGFSRSDFDYDVRYNNVFGVINFTLDAGRYRWDFITTNGTLDSGSEDCHAAPGAKPAGLSLLLPPGSFNE